MDNKIAVTVVADFFDGTLAEVFRELGYPAFWKRGEKRNLPSHVIKAVTNSGGVISIPNEDAKESKIIVGAEPTVPDGEALARQAYHKVPLITVVFPKGFKDGSLSSELAALGHPADFGVGEIGQLPKSLIDRIVASGGFVETNRETIAQYKNQQGKHQLKVRQWQAERENQKQAALRLRETVEHNKPIQAEIAKLETRYLAARGQTKEVLWQRLETLRSQLQ